MPVVLKVLRLAEASLQPLDMGPDADNFARCAATGMRVSCDEKVRATAHCRSRSRPDPLIHHALSPPLPSSHLPLIADALTLANSAPHASLRTLRRPPISVPVGRDTERVPADRGGQRDHQVRSLRLGPSLTRSRLGSSRLRGRAASPFEGIATDVLGALQGGRCKVAAEERDWQAGVRVPDGALPPRVPGSSVQSLPSRSPASSRTRRRSSAPLRSGLTILSPPRRPQRLARSSTCRTRTIPRDCGCSTTSFRT